MPFCVSLLTPRLLKVTKNSLTMSVKIFTLCLLMTVALTQELNECDRGCTYDYRPVCGTFRKTFPNACSMKAEACAQAAQGYHLLHDKEGECSCPQMCPRIHMPVCGSDGETYGNECELRNKSCQEGQWIEVAREGECVMVS